ncbi:MAG TPA: hypothetical protein VKV40_15720 [Ktedonobacteraceae bacterium]|nr:hypothetical protein [Ktedonobacteraceae bacterium]
MLYKPERNHWGAAATVIAICLLPVIVFILIALWPQRVLVAWILLGLGILAVLVKLAQWLIKSGTAAKIQLAEEALRSGRLYANERLIERDARRKEEWAEQRQLMDEPEEPYIQRPYTHSSRRREPTPHEAPDVPYDGGLPPMSIRSDWEDYKR